MTISISVGRTLVELRHENNPPVVLGTPAQKTATVSLTPNRGFRGEKGEKGDPGASGAGYVHTEPLPSTTWVIDHNLGFWPNIYVYDTNGDECEGDVDNVSLNRCVINFSAPFAGIARLT
ncbi:hypothetical protein RCCWILLIS_15 [Rhodobacter phage RcCWillis]|nr:hypothetical protein RCCWILLIS_15 [Rhodobacter phage RcCWillis]